MEEEEIRIEHKGHKGTKARREEKRELRRMERCGGYKYFDADYEDGRGWHG